MGISQAFHETIALKKYAYPPVLFFRLRRLKTGYCLPNSTHKIVVFALKFKILLAGNSPPTQFCRKLYVLCYVGLVWHQHNMKGTVIFYVTTTYIVVVVDP